RDARACPRRRARQARSRHLDCRPGRAPGVDHRDPWARLSSLGSATPVGRALAPQGKPVGRRLVRTGHAADPGPGGVAAISRPAAGPPAPAVAERAERLATALEGNPLAIELAAPSAQILGVDGLLARLAVHADGASG